VFSLERAIEWCCDLAPAIPLPSVKLRLRDPEDIEMNDGLQWTTWKEWYGDLSQLFHCFVHMPVFNFCQDRIQSKMVELGYDKVKEMFYEEDKKFWDEEQELITDEPDHI
jgi:hypothetical protein